jgi:hypothetical protein
MLLRVHTRCCLCSITALHFPDLDGKIPAAAATVTPAIQMCGQNLKTDIICAGLFTVCSLSICELLSAGQQNLTQPKLSFHSCASYFLRIISLASSAFHVFTLQAYAFCKRTDRRTGNQPRSILPPTWNVSDI